MSQKYIKSQNKNSHNAKSQLPRLFQVLVRLTTSTSNATRQCSNKFGIALAAYSVHKAFALRVNLVFFEKTSGECGVAAEMKQ